MAYSKNDIVQVTIEDIGVTGEGIGKIDGYTLFVKDTVIGDVVEVKIMKGKEELRICQTYEYHNTVKGQGYTGM